MKRSPCTLPSSVALLNIGLLCSGCLYPEYGAKTPLGGISKELFYETQNSTVSSLVLLKPRNGQILIGVDKGNCLDVVKFPSGDILHTLAAPNDLAIGDQVLFRRGDEDRFIAISAQTSTFHLLNHELKEIWSFRFEDGLPRSWGIGDLDGDGVCELNVLGLKGLYLLSEEGKLLSVFRQSRDFPLHHFLAMIVLSCQGEKRKERLLTYDIGGYFRYWDSNLKEVGKFRGPFLPLSSDIRACNWPSPGNILARSGSRFYILDPCGKLILKWSVGLPAADDIFGIRAEPIDFSGVGTPYLAVWYRFRATSGRSVLSVFTPEKKQIYKEVLHPSGALLAVKAESTGREILLVGDGTKVWRYSSR